MDYLSPLILGSKCTALSTTLGSLFTVDNVPTIAADSVDNAAKISTFRVPASSHLRFLTCPLQIQTCVEEWLNAVFSDRSIINFAINEKTRKFIFLLLEQRFQIDVLRLVVLI
jgi:hypothetical protein